MDYQINLIQNKKYKEINFNKVSKIHISGEEINKKENSENKNNNIDNNYHKLNNLDNVDNFSTKLNKLIHSMKKYSENEKKINIINIQDFKRSIFTDYSKNKNLILPFNSIDNFNLSQKEINNNRIQQKENSFLGFKSKRYFINEFDKQKLFNYKSNEEENKSFVIFKDGVIKIKTNEFIDTNEKNEIFKINL
jgi:hypothetical protein